MKQHTLQFVVSGLYALTAGMHFAIGMPGIATVWIVGGIFHFSAGVIQKKTELLPIDFPPPQKALPTQNQGESQ